MVMFHYSFIPSKWESVYIALKIIWNFVKATVKNRMFMFIPSINVMPISTCNKIITVLLNITYIFIYVL